MSQSEAMKLSPLFPVRTLGESLVQKIKILLTHAENRRSLGAVRFLLGKMSVREHHRAPLHTDSHSSLYFQLLRYKHTQHPQIATDLQCAHSVSLTLSRMVIKES